MAEATRPDPDALLAKIKQDKKLSSRGELKIFFGACAGVGKTYSMLNEAKQRFTEGVDLVAGIVETHGRSDTARMLEGLPQIPRKKIQYRDKELEELDIDAALARKPKLILVDELAHTNAPGSRHPKRWQDIEELLSNGIDVYTTLNVQHLESINDLVARTSGIQVKETVPDTVFDHADHIALIDITTDELLNRLAQGKVYIAEQAKKHAAENFFRKRNLIALRELALRRTAERVDAQMGLESPAQTDKPNAMLSERILVCIGHDSLSTRIIRHAKRLATRMRVPWYAVYVETRRHYRLNRTAQEAVERNMQLAERMGATVALLKGDSAVEEVLNYAREKRISRIMVGTRHKGWLYDTLVGSLAEKLIRKSTHIEISVITESGKQKKSPFTLPKIWVTPSRFFYAVLMVALCTSILFPFQDTPYTDSFSMIYLIGVMLTAMRFGTLPSILTSILSIGAYNFFFVEPYHTLNIHNSQYHFIFLAMFVASLVIGSIASRLRLQMMFYRQKEQETRHLFSLAKVLSSTRGHESMAEAAGKYIGDSVDALVTIWYPSASGELTVISSADIKLDIREKSAAQWAFENKQEAGSGTDTLSGTKGRYLPLMEEDAVVGVMGIIPLTEQPIQPEQLTMLEAFTTIIAISLQRANKAVEAEQAKIDMEAEKLRNVLLQSISHDLRTPLVSISGLAGELLLRDVKLPTKSREMVQVIHDQSSRLSRMVNNLLDITSLEAGKIMLNRQPYFMEEIIGAALERVKNILPEDRVSTHIRAKDLIELDGLLIEQVFTNLLENSVRHSLGQPHITITVEDRKKYLHISVADDGSGIPKGEEQKIFEKFYKGEKGGTGLGLAICRTIIEAHEGKIWAKNSESGGAVFNFTLPKTISAAGETDAA